MLFHDFIYAIPIDNRYNHLRHPVRLISVIAQPFVLYDHPALETDSHGNAGIQPKNTAAIPGGVLEFSMETQSNGNLQLRWMSDDYKIFGNMQSCIGRYRTRISVQPRIYLT